MEEAADLPHTITFALLYRARLSSFGELPKDKRPPRAIWDRPYELEQFLDHVWDADTDSSNFKPSKSYEYNLEDVE